VSHWLERHQGAVSFALHIVGIPLTILGVLLLPLAAASLTWKVAVVGLTLFIAGYALQFLGHYLEGSDPGEIVLLKRKMGLPYVEFAPRRRRRMA
jgi:uncharacterized membrane protein YGL010W